MTWAVVWSASAWRAALDFMDSRRARRRQDAAQERADTEVHCSSVAVTCELVDQVAVLRGARLCSEEESRSDA